MEKKQTLKATSDKSTERNRVLNEASERLLGITPNASEMNPANRAEKAIRLLESLQEKRKG